MKGQILITGAAKNLGRALAKALAKERYPLILHYHKSEKEAAILASECRDLGTSVKLVSADFSTEQGVLTLSDELKNEPLYALIHNVGPTLLTSLDKTTSRDWYGLFQSNLHTPFLLTKALKEQLRKTQGRVIHFGVAGSLRGKLLSCSPAYSIAKNALVNLTSALAKEIYPVTVNMVSIGYLPHSLGLPDIDKLPMKRTLHFEEITRVVSFLLEENSQAITGQNIEVAGGVGL